MYLNLDTPSFAFLRLKHALPWLSQGLYDWSKCVETWLSQGRTARSSTRVKSGDEEWHFNLPSILKIEIKQIRKPLNPLMLFQKRPKPS